MAYVYQILTPPDIRYFTKYDSSLVKGHLAQKLDHLLARSHFMGSFANVGAVNATHHFGLVAGSFVPGDRYYDTGASAFYTNTALVIGPATWTAG